LKRTSAVLSPLRRVVRQHPQGEARLRETSRPTARPWGYEVCADAGSSFRWRTQASNGQTVASSGGSFDSRSNAERAAENVRVNGGNATGPQILHRRHAARQRASGGDWATNPHSWPKRAQDHRKLRSNQAASQNAPNHRDLQGFLPERRSRFSPAIATSPAVPRSTRQALPGQERFVAMSRRLTSALVRCAGGSAPYSVDM
jgi:uncharacterized protein YegP (UPF0339 family)